MRKRDRKQVEQQVVKLARGGMSIRDIRLTAHVSYSTIITVCAAHKVPLASSTVEKSMRYAKTLAAVPDEKWREWAAAGAKLRQAAAEAGVPRDAFSDYAAAHGRIWWAGTGRPRNVEVRQRDKLAEKLRHVAKHAPQQLDSWPTRQDYANQCNAEFSTPHFLRKAPGMLRMIEAREAQERVSRRGRGVAS